LMSYGWAIRQMVGEPLFDGEGLFTGYSVPQVYNPSYGTVPARTVDGGFVAGEDGYVQAEWVVKPQTRYEVRVNATDTSGNASDWSSLSAANFLVSAADEQGPSAPTWVGITVAFRSAT